MSASSRATRIDRSLTRSLSQMSPFPSWASLCHDMRVATAVCRAAKRYAKLSYRPGEYLADLEDQAIDLLSTAYEKGQVNVVKLATFDDYNLRHDVGGMFAYMDTEGTMSHHFEPRCGRIPDA